MHAHAPLQELVVQVTYRNILKPGPKFYEEVYMCLLHQTRDRCIDPSRLDKSRTWDETFYVFIIIKLIQSNKHIMKIIKI